MWMLWLASRTLTPVDLGLFLLIRRLADTGSNFMHLGAPVALRRYLTISRHPADKSAHFSASLILSAGGMLACMLALAVAPGFWGRLFVGTAPDADKIAIFTGLMSCALVVHFLVNSALLARGNIITANLIELVNVAVAPVAAMYIVRHIDARELVGVQVATIACVSLAMLVTLGLRFNAEAGERIHKMRTGHVIENATYGLPRAAGLALETGFLVIGPWLLREDLAAAGYLGIAFFLLRLARTVIQPVTILVAMRLGSLHTRGAHDDVQRGFDFIIVGVLLSAVAILPSVHAWSSVILELWLGDQLGAAVHPYVQLLLIAIIPLSLLQALKEPIEIMWKKPFVLGLYGVGSLALLACGYLLTPYFGATDGITGAYVVAYTLMCMGALLIIRDRISPRAQFGLVRLGLLGCGAWAVNFVATKAAAVLPLWERISIMLLVGAFTTLLVIVGYLFLMPSPLVRQFRDYLIAARRRN